MADSLAVDVVKCPVCFQEHSTSLCHTCGTQTMHDHNLENILECKRHQLEYVQIWQVREYLEEVKKELDKLRTENYHLKYQPGGPAALAAQKHFEEVLGVKGQQKTFDDNHEV